MSLGPAPGRGNARAERRWAPASFAGHCRTRLNRPRSLTRPGRRDPRRQNLPARNTPSRSRRRHLEEIMEALWIVAALAGYVVIMRWILPRLGVPT